MTSLPIYDCRLPIDFFPSSRKIGNRQSAIGNSNQSLLTSAPTKRISITNGWLISDGKLLIGSYDGVLYSLDAATVRGFINDPDPKIRITGLRVSESMYKGGDHSFEADWKKAKSKFLRVFRLRFTEIGQRIPLRQERAQVR